MGEEGIGRYDIFSGARRDHGRPMHGKHIKSTSCAAPSSFVTESSVPAVKYTDTQNQGSFLSGPLYQVLFTCLTDQDLSSPILHILIEERISWTACEAPGRHQGGTRVLFPPKTSLTSLKTWWLSRPRLMHRPAEPTRQGPGATRASWRSDVLKALQTRSDSK